MTIEEIIKEAFSQGWNASHECATDFDYEYALKNCLSDLDSEVKKLNIPDVSQRSELLKAFYAYVDDKWALGMLTDKVDEVIEGFEKAFNCGLRSKI